LELKVFKKGEEPSNIGLYMLKHKLAIKLNIISITCIPLNGGDGQLFFWGKKSPKGDKCEGLVIALL
jgi:hypothetical protein